MRESLNIVCKMRLYLSFHEVVSCRLDRVLNRLET